ncbi:MAG TPA: HAMP domain-containing sensor histidine kinase [Gemmatimonadaceae bacterium]|nr:HAMP domain-containing sensor histidine kinase [Gemmatimonadaceae bacterium]
MPALRIPFRWTSLLLLASIALTTLGVIEASRAVRSQRAVAERALRDYAGFAAWSYQQHLRERLDRATEEAVGSYNHGHDVHRSSNVPPVESMALYLPMDQRCKCNVPKHGPTPFAFLAFRIGTDTLGVALNAYPRPREGWALDRLVPAALRQEMPEAMRREGASRYPAEIRAWLNDTITRQVRARHDIGRFPVIVATRDSARRFITYTVMPRLAGDTLIYAAEYDAEAFEGILRRTMTESDLLPSTFSRGRPVHELVELQVTDATGRTLFQSDSIDRWSLDDTASVGETFGNLRVRAQIRAAMADQLVIGGLPRSKLPFLLALLAVAAALSFVAIGQIRREGELARLREDFVASISHELRTPLAQMRLYLETLRLGRFTTDAQRQWSLDNVERETTRLGHLVERVLRFSRTGRGAPDPRVPVDVRAEVERLVAEFQPLADARGAHLVAELEPVPPVALQPDALRHVVLNLLDNAVKYGPRGQTVRLRLAGARVRESAGAGEVRIEIIDEGPGIPATERERIWKPYQRGSTVGGTAGSGVGLSVVRDVMAQHGGRAWVDDAPAGRGARFVVTLPAANAAAVSAAEVSDVIEQAGAAPAHPRTSAPAHR